MHANSEVKYNGLLQQVFNTEKLNPQPQDPVLAVHLKTIGVRFITVSISDSGVSGGGQPQMYIISVYLKLKRLYSLLHRTILYIYCTIPSELTRITSSTI